MENTYYRRDGRIKGCKPCALAAEHQRRRRIAAAEGREIRLRDPDAFGCGHPKSLSNTRWKNERNAGCRTCHRLQQKARYHADPDRHRKAASDYQRENRAARSAYHREWYRKNLDAQRARGRAVARERKLAPGDVETLDYIDIIMADPCVYCGRPAEAVDHIQARRRGGPNHWSNYAPACDRCNQSKHAKPLLAFLLRHPIRQDAYA